MATYYVDTTTGDNSDTGLTELLAWATIDYAANQVAAGDHVYVKGGVDYTEMATLVTVGTATASIIFEGYTTTPGDGGKFTIDATGENNGVYQSLSTNIYYCFRNMIVKNATYDGVNLSGRYQMVFENCEANDNGTRGFDTGGYITFMNCSATGNGDDGISATADSKFVFCTAHNNGGYGLTCVGYSSVFYSCRASLNDDGGIAAARGTLIANCTVDGDGSGTANCIDVASYSEYGQVIVNNIIYDGDGGINGDSTVCEGFQLGANNLLNSNSGADYYSWATHAQATDITSAPGFTDEAGGDYTLGASSAARNAGADASGTSSPGMDIGAYQAADAGGGGRVVITG